MASVLITKNSFSRIKKAIKRHLESDFNIEIKLSDLSQCLSKSFGFSSEYALQKHFDTEVDSSSLSKTKAYLIVKSEYEKDVKEMISNQLGGYELIHALGHPFYCLTSSPEEACKHYEDACIIPVFVKTTDLVESSNAALRGDTYDLALYLEP